MKLRLHACLGVIAMAVPGSWASAPRPGGLSPPATDLQLTQTGRQEWACAVGVPDSAEVGARLAARRASPHGQAIASGLEWLALHQRSGGSWDADGFMHDDGRGLSCSCDGAGREIHDVGITGLALLAFLGDGNTARQGPHKDVVSRGIQWLRTQQDKDSGLIGDRTGRACFYEHAIATLAICEAYDFSKNPLVLATAQDAVHALLSAGNAHSAWSFDASATGWILMALESAERGGLRIDRGQLARLFASSGIDVDLGQLESGGASEGLLAFLAHRSPGRWMDRCGPDVYFDALAVQRRNLASDLEWRRALESSLRAAQRHGNHLAGSWDPTGVPYAAFGRVGSTALVLLALEVPIRFARVVPVAPCQER